MGGGTHWTASLSWVNVELNVPVGKPARNNQLHTAENEEKRKAPGRKQGTVTKHRKRPALGDVCNHNLDAFWTIAQNAAYAMSSPCTWVWEAPWREGKPWCLWEGKATPSRVGASREPPPWQRAQAVFQTLLAFRKVTPEAPRWRRQLHPWTARGQLSVAVWALCSEGGFRVPLLEITSHSVSSMLFNSPGLDLFTDKLCRVLQSLCLYLQLYKGQHLEYCLTNGEHVINNSCYCIFLSKALVLSFNPASHLRKNSQLHKQVSRMQGCRAGMQCLDSSPAL